jgi:hypothetical protein
MRQIPVNTCGLPKLRSATQSGIWKNRARSTSPLRKWIMFRLLTLLVTLVKRLLRSRRDLVLESLALRQQLAATSIPKKCLLAHGPAVDQDALRWG